MNFCNKTTYSTNLKASKITVLRGWISPKGILGKATYGGILSCSNSEFILQTGVRGPQNCGTERSEYIILGKEEKYT